MAQYFVAKLDVHAFIYLMFSFVSLIVYYVFGCAVFKRCVFVDFPAKYVGLDADETRVLKNRVAVGLSWLSLYVQNAISHFTDNKNIQQVL